MYWPVKLIMEVRTSSSFRVTAKKVNPSHRPLVQFSHGVCSIITGMKCSDKLLFDWTHFFLVREPFFCRTIIKNCSGTDGDSLTVHSWQISNTWNEWRDKEMGKDYICRCGEQKIAKCCNYIRFEALSSYVCTQLKLWYRSMYSEWIKSLAVVDHVRAIYTHT